MTEGFAPGLPALAPGPRARSQVVRSFWHGPNLSAYERACLRSFAAHGHRVELFAYRALAVPPGVALRDARSVLPEARLVLVNGSVAAFADLFRYHLLRDLGGWWIDADVVCLRPDLPARGLFLAWQDGELINNAVLRAPAGHRLPARLAAEAERLGPSTVWGALGPALVTRVARELRLAVRAAPPAAAYPVPWPQALALLDPGRRAEVEARAAGAHFLHLWNEIWRQRGVDKRAAPPPGSFARDLLDRYG